MKKTSLNTQMDRRSAFKVVGKGALGSIFIFAGAFSPPAYALDPWTEIARGIAKGIAEFSKQAFEQLTIYWENTQREADKKVMVAKGLGIDNKIDFRMQVENLRRILKTKQSESLCNKESEDAQHHQQVEQEKARLAQSRNPSDLIVGNESSKALNKGIEYFGVRNGRIDSIELYKNVSNVMRQDAKGEEISAENAIGLSKVTIGQTAALAMEPMRKLSQMDPAVANNPVFARTVNQSTFNVSLTSFSSKIYFETLKARPSNFVEIKMTERKAIEKIKSRYKDAAYRSEIVGEPNEVALAAQYVKMLGEKIYVLNAQYKQNQKIMALLAMRILANDKKEKDAEA